MFSVTRSKLAVMAALVVGSSLTTTTQAVSYIDAVAASNPQYWYRFEGATTAAGVANQGSTGAVFNATYAGGFTNANLSQTSAYAGLGKAIEFTGPIAGSGTNKFVQFGAAIPELTNIRPGVDKTTSVEYWMQSTQSGTHGGNNWQNPSLLGTESPGDGDMYWGNLPQNGTGDFRFSTSDANEITVRDVANGQWQHVVMVKEWVTAGTTRSTLYINGGSAVGGRTVSVTTASGNPSQQDGDSLIDRLGVTKAGELDNVQYIGRVDEVAIYNRGLSAAEVASHYTSVAGSLVGLYRFETVAVGLDSGQRANNLIAQGNAQQTAGGRFGSGLVLDGNGDMLNVNLAQIAPTGLSVGDGSYAIAAWFKPDVAGNLGIVGWGNYGNSNQVTAIRTNGANSMAHYWWDIDQAPGGLNLLDGQFHHVVAMYDSTSGLRSLLVDGIVVATDSPIDHNAAGINFAVGKTFGGEFFDGVLDDVAIFNRALTTQEIAAIRAGDFSGFLAAAAIPEPATALTGMLAMGLLAVRRRRVA